MHTVSNGADANVGAAGVVTTPAAEDGVDIGAAGLVAEVAGSFTPTADDG